MTSSPGRSTTSSSSPGQATGPDKASGGTGGSTPSPPAGGGTSPSGPVTKKVALDDRADDTAVEGTGKAKSESRADIVRSEAFYASNAIIFTVLTRDPVDPSQDPHWQSDSSFVTWEVDTNDDRVTDYEVQFAVSEGSLIGGVSRPGEADVLECEAEAVYTSERYAVAIDPACAGTPASLSYRVKVNYDSDPTNEDADVITDLAPAGGWSRPLARP